MSRSASPGPMVRWNRWGYLFIAFMIILGNLAFVRGSKKGNGR